ncbi:MAG: AEC family transporter [Roseburia sp.]|uniref:AEC family transporter n=1 Tax=Roseburia amylophila TaxID=2981794 RepID=UPI0032C10DCA
MTSVGNVSFSLALIFLGATLSYISLKNLDFIYDYFFLVIVKMILIPVGVAAVVSHFLTPTETTILTLMACMPAMSAIPMMAENYHSDAEFASKTCFVMTLCSVFTIPLVFFLKTML